MRIVNLYPDLREIEIMREASELSNGGVLGPYVVLSGGDFLLGENTRPVTVELCKYEYHGQLPKPGKWLFASRSVPEGLEILRLAGGCLGWYGENEKATECTPWYGEVPKHLERGDY